MALKDPSPRVRVKAVGALISLDFEAVPGRPPQLMGKWRMPEALPAMVRQLRHPSPIARMGIASGFQAYAEEIAIHLPALEAAYAQEPEGPAKKTLEAAIRRARAAK